VLARHIIIMDPSAVVDGGVGTGKVIHHVSVGSLRPGQSKTLNFSRRALNEVHSVTHSDLHNTDAISIKTHQQNTDGFFGLSMMRNTEDGDFKQLETKSRQVFLTDNAAHGVHHVAHPGATDATTVNLMRTELSDKDAELAVKRGTSLWRDHDNSTIHHGVYESTVEAKDGKKETSFVVTDDSAAGKFIGKNIGTLFKDLNNGDKITTAPNGQKAYVVTEKRFKSDIFPTLNKALTPASSNHHGYSMVVTNLGSETTSPDAKMTIETTFHRTPIGQKRSSVLPVTFDSTVSASPSQPKAAAVVDGPQPVIKEFDPSSLEDNE
jgi:hypothetical protein